ncbi:MAG: hypothetical protein Q8P50_06945 [Bacillota bacterium]|nr:hypothetical protein [Bacillota bacterium]
MGIARRDLYRLIESLPDKQLPAVKKYLESLMDDQVAALRRAFEAAPVDDEPLTDEDRKAIAEAETDIKAGRVRVIDPKKELWP